VALKWIRCENGAVLLGGHIGGGLDLRGARLTGYDGPALNADRVIVEQDLLCTDGFAAAGGVWLSGAHIGGRLNMSGTHLTCPDAAALTAETITVDQDMVCTKGFLAEGGVRLNGAHIGGQLDLGDAHLIPNHEAELWPPKASPSTRPCSAMRSSPPRATSLFGVPRQRACLAASQETIRLGPPGCGPHHADHRPGRHVAGSPGPGRPGIGQLGWAERAGLSQRQAGVAAAGRRVRGLPTAGVQPARCCLPSSWRR
jgi:hypothetical protein